MCASKTNAIAFVIYTTLINTSVNKVIQDIPFLVSRFQSHIFEKKNEDMLPKH